jgi:hypothetical protein
MAKAIPIRLVQENGNLIELDATNMVLSTTRKVGGSALPWTGSRRIGMDWNINKAMINIQGVIADDRQGTVATKHSATIDFGYYIETLVEGGGISSRGGGRAYSVAREWGTSANLQNLLGVELRLQSFTAANIAAMDTISFTNTASAGGTAYSSNGGAGSTPTILVNTSDGTPEQIATAVAAYINAQLSSKYSASVPTNGGKKTTGSLVATDASTLVSIEMSTSGSDTAMKIDTPKFVRGDGSYFIDPVITKFFGGKDSVKKSAGDKAQDLYGVINNSTRRSHGITARGIFRPSGRLDEIKDYIVGIQIPYNSTIKAEGGEEYVARNFFMPTGFYYGKEKTSEGNNNPASVTFDMSEETTGIQGAVQKMDITYDAGESVYSFNMIFAPIDNMILS